jgi:hypothetical protein
MKSIYKNVAFELIFWQYPKKFYAFYITRVTAPLTPYWPLIQNGRLGNTGWVTGVVAA